jgi:hypothetical protein
MESKTMEENSDYPGYAYLIVQNYDLGDELDETEVKAHFTHYFAFEVSLDPPGILLVEKPDPACEE